MALGLSSGLVWDSCAVTVPPIIDPLDINFMLLWWDFTDSTQLFQEVDSFTTAADANNDLIGRVKNKAITAQTNLGVPDVSRIGTFGRADADNHRPSFKTGGANGYSYAQFDSTGVPSAIVTKQGSGFGSHDDGDNLMGSSELNPIISTGALTILTVAEADNDDNDGAEESIYDIKFIQATGSNAGNDRSYHQKREDETNPGGGQASRISYSNLTEAGAQASGIPPSNTGQMNPEKLEVRFTSIGLSGPGTAQAQRGLNTFNIANFNGYEAGIDGAFQALTMRASGGDSNVTLGSRLNTSLDGFDGKIYEFIMFNSTLDVDTMNGLAWYYAQKYGIDIQGAN